MDYEEDLLTIPINPNNFPAKLWRLVNCPKTRSIRWDGCGQGVMIDQQLFEAELLSPMKPNGEASDLFKTTNFTSFIRQLNLYGFRKVVLAPGNAEQPEDKEFAMMEGVQHHFHNPNFKKDHPELLVNLKRLTSTNKAKLEAGLEVNCRPPSRFRRQMGNSPEDNDRRFEKQGAIYPGPVHRGVSRDKVAHPYHRGLGQPKEYDRTPIPARGWLMGHGDASSPTTFYTDKGVPVSVIRRFMMDPAQSSPTTVHVQQGAPSVSINGQKLNAFHPHHPQYRPGFYSAVCQCCTPGNMDNEMNSGVHQAPAFPHYSYYQPNYQVGFLHPGGNQNQEWQNAQESQDTKKTEVNLDTVFQIVDELQASPKVRMVKLETPEKDYDPSEEPHHEATVHSVSDQGSSQCDASGPVNNAGAPIAMDSTTMTPYGPVPVGGIIISVPGNVSSGIAITVNGNTTNLTEAASGGSGEHRLALPGPAPAEYPSTSASQMNQNCEAVQSVEPHDSAADNEVVATINFSDLATTSQEEENCRKHTKSPDLNMLVEVACNQDS
ncbi:heat shock factor protein 5 isoform X2 [Engraulis encrasicolus]|uniref:heat shock factor protein 5 isoform X2 n=1 Tax=Engraulis encrasicolus TaxID=184585 RepID=UPI002FCEA941